MIATHILATQHRETDCRDPSMTLTLTLWLCALLKIVLFWRAYQTLS